MEAGNAQPSAPLPLDQIQGNIAGFNKPLQSFVPLSFEPGQKARDFIHAVLREIDTAAAVEAFNRRYKWHRKRGDELPTSEWFNLLLSAKGLEALEAPELEQFPSEFREGMRARAAAIGDVDRSAPEQWDPLFGEEIHAYRGARRRRRRAANALEGTDRPPCPCQPRDDPRHDRRSRTRSWRT